jgi:hypothetical protein
VPGTVWNVFSVTADGQIIDVNSFEFISTPGSVGRLNMTTSAFDEPEQLKDYELEGYEEPVEEEPMLGAPVAEPTPAEDGGEEAPAEVPAEVTEAEVVPETDVVPEADAALEVDASSEADATPAEAV